MASQAFALSPISARASLPSEEDYEAIREAFMETARGRWFLDEYARRNRNADTSMVLDAVARIEEALAEQKKPPPPVIVDRLPAALISIRSAVEKAQGAASTALDRLQLEENLAPIRKGSRIIKEISWRWREIGADGRICDLIDSQVAAIDAACAQLAETDPRVALRAAFEIIRSEVEAFRSGDETAVTAARSVPEAAAGRSPAPALASIVAEMTVAPTQTDEEPTPREVETAFNEPEIPAEIAAAEVEAEQLTPQQADAQDEAVLEMVAMEMAAPDPDEAQPGPDAAVERALAAESEELMHVTVPPVVEPDAAVVQEIEPELPPVAAEAPALQPVLISVPSVAAPDRSVLTPTPFAALEPVVGTSLGSTLIASGILRKPKFPANDPLAPIRRMSQAEKIAFFS